jgi:hypothetical protein
LINYFLGDFTMALPISIDTTFKRTYSATFETVFQQMVSELRGTVRNEFQEGEMKLWDFIGPTSVQWDLPRNSDTPNIPTPYSRRKSVLHRANWGEYIDTWDKIKMLKDPTSDTIRMAVMAFNRAIDERILQAAYATVYTGKDGDTAVLPYDVGECRLIESTGTEVTAGSNFTNVQSIGLNLATIALAGKLMDNASVPKEDRYIVANTDQKWYLLGSTKVTSSDYNTVKALVNGQIDTYMGFTFKWLPSDRFETNAQCTSYPAYNCVAYQKSAMLLGMNKDITTTVDTIPQKTNSVLAQAEMYIGGVRLQGPGVVLMPLLKAPTMSFSQS